MREGGGGYIGQRKMGEGGGREKKLQPHVCYRTKEKMYNEREYCTVKKSPSSRIRTSDLWMTAPLQSTALPTELSKDS